MVDRVVKRRHRLGTRDIEMHHRDARRHCVLGSIKKLSRDAQCTDLVTSGPCIPDLVGLANASHQHSAANMRTADDRPSVSPLNETNSFVAFSIYVHKNEFGFLNFILVVTAKRDPISVIVVPTLGFQSDGRQSRPKEYPHVT
jgi:hypothetical protein